MLKRVHGDDLGDCPGRSAAQQGLRPAWNFILWSIVALYAAVEIVRALLPDAIPLAAATATFLPFLFALRHGLESLALKDLAGFVGICFVVSSALGALALIATVRLADRRCGD